MPVTDITLNKIVDIIKAAAECHTMLNDVFVGEDSSKGFNDKEKRELNYPYLWIDFAPSSLVISEQKIIQTKVYNIVLFVADKQYDNIKNDVEILSDTEGILSDIIQYVLTNKELKEYTTASGSIPVTFGRDATKDGVFGCTATFPIRVRYIHCANTLPIPCDITPLPPPSGGIVPAGILYKRVNFTAMTTSYRTGDDAYNRINNPFSVRPANPLYVAELDYTDAAPFLTLLENNAFGNKDRFTNSLGLTSSYDGTGGELIGYTIDHLTGLGWMLSQQTTAPWSTAIDTPLTTTYAGFTDFKLPNIKQQLSIYNYQIRLNYAPFSIGGSWLLWSSTTRFDFTANANYSDHTGRVLNSSKTVSSRKYMVCRNHY